MVLNEGLSVKLITEPVSDKGRAMMVEVVVIVICKPEAMFYVWSSNVSLFFFFFNI